MTFSRLAALALALWLLGSFSNAGMVRAEETPPFELGVQPLLAKRCGKCHNAKVKKGGLDLSSMASLRRGGESGEPAVGENLDDSLLWQMIDGGEMPPEGEPTLTEAERGRIEAWIEAGSPAQSTAARRTQHDALPYLYARCVTCHGRHRQEGGLDLRTVESMLKGGKSGPAIVPGKPEESLLLKRVLAKDMPPPKLLIKAGVRPLEATEITQISEWIEHGAREFPIAPDRQTDQPDPLVTAKDREYWAFQRPRKPTPPGGGDSVVDRFLLRQLKQRGLSFSPEADRLTLIRRVAMDLTGLPPQWEDVQRFQADASDAWYSRMVDHYLDSPHYGERWGRHWLDLAGYADSEGKRSADPLRLHAWRYRDYVVEALNEDRPYDQFLLEQLAGDELYDFPNAPEVTREMMRAVVATGFLRMAPDGTGSDIVDTVEERFEVIADELEVLGSSVLGLTLRCAQCHSHKYDPIPQRDYYRLVAVFAGAYDVYDWLKPTSVAGQSKQKDPNRRFVNWVADDEHSAWQAEQDALSKRIAELEASLAREAATHRAALVQKQLQTLPEVLRDDLQTMLKTAAEKRNEVQRYLAAKFEKRLTFNNKQIGKKFPEFAKREEAAKKQMAAWRAEATPQPLVRALWDRGEPSPTWVFRRGQFNNPGALVGPGVLSVLTDGQTPFVASPGRSGSTGRRLAFARWLVAPEHPLTARVLVNRVWFHHFGRGIVPTLANFGRTGSPPSHPELLDWLAVSLVEHGWSLKWLHREMLNTAAYRQRSELRDEHQRKDPDNRWLSRMPLRRLEAEMVRDSLLAVAGQLDHRAGGRPDPVVVRDDGLVTARRGPQGWRRTIYVQQRRKELPTILETFDLPQMSPNCVERPNSTVAPQALHLLNNGLVRELALEFARRIESEVPEDAAAQVQRIYQIALSRPPSEKEQQLAVQTLARLTAEWEANGAKESKSPPKTRALASLCHVIMNSAAFLFVD